VARKKVQPAPQEPLGYFALARRPWHNLLFILPPLVIFHISLAIEGTDLLVPQLFQSVLGRLGAPGLHMPGVVIVAMLLFQHLRSKDSWQISPLVLGGMLIEAAVWTLPLVALTFLVPTVPAGAAATGPVAGLGKSILQALGAGIYEEFLFRLVFLSVVMLVFVDLLDLPKKPIAICGLIISSLAFSLLHPGWGYDLFSAEFLSYFGFLAIAGLLWGTVFIYRGLGIAIGSHILYDLYAIWVMLPGATS